ncbi:modulator of drug activity B [Tenacibaculum sp. MAR_2009_124]|uniref:NAD(P)H-dependent oxidoreductase n=1 Tax=Tenacibaculum sp. MAR_2009_124 TaxID=1250059 RepID=UPI00089D1E0C|nr:NAD(P)H-dependent oxidoreductase [Tenacibaculum sp. MAR_2009_124]SEC40618.1 modulator of drug activity B [Tenacibaculum sp. MAR_2009_124]
MKNVLIINGWHSFSEAKGQFNKSLSTLSTSFFYAIENYTVKTTQINDGYDIEKEVLKFTWADVIIYHTPVWWFSIPFKFKKYFDEVLTAGYNNGLWISDGRSSKNPKINYGTGGLLSGKQYILTSSWNAPEEAFTMTDEFFDQTSVDKGVLSGFHAMNKYLGMNLIDSLHFHDVEKNADVHEELKKYNLFLEKNFMAQV